MSVEGVIAWALLCEGGGQWRRAGIDGSPVGLDLGICLARPMAADGDAEALEYLLLQGEAAALTALQREAAARA